MKSTISGCSILYVIFDKENCSEEENHEEDKVQRQLGGEDLKELRVAIPEESGIAEPLQATQEKE